jgi:hypothetical protein
MGPGSSGRVEQVVVVAVRKCRHLLEQVPLPLIDVALSLVHSAFEEEAAVLDRDAESCDPPSLSLD